MADNGRYGRPVQVHHVDAALSGQRQHYTPSDHSRLPPSMRNQDPYAQHQYQQQYQQQQRYQQHQQQRYQQHSQHPVARQPAPVGGQDTRPPVQEWAAADGRGTGCAYNCSRFCCCALCPKIGNMTPLVQTIDSRTGKRKLWCIVGPFWPVMLFVTCPLILGISFVVGYFLLPELHIAVAVIFCALVFLTMAALFATACVDPGMLPRHKERPAVEGGEMWYFSDIAQTFRPPRAAYCHMCRVVFQDIDHVCPWTGTAIAKNNMPAFKTFTTMVIVLVMYELFVIIWGAIQVSR